jgi:hypothetical protein
MPRTIKQLELTKKLLNLKRDLPGISDELADIASYIWASLEEKIRKQNMPVFATRSKIARIAGLSANTVARKLEAKHVPCRISGKRHIYNTQAALKALES